jgi:hypothetical protein
VGRLEKLGEGHAQPQNFINTSAGDYFLSMDKDLFYIVGTTGDAGGTTKIN